MLSQVRLKRFLEMRGADSGPWRMICALPALWVGLLYDADAQAAALDLISDWTQQEMDYLRAEVPRQGLATPFRDGTVRDVAAKVLDMARGGLERRGSDEVHFLTQLQVGGFEAMAAAACSSCGGHRLLAALHCCGHGAAVWCPV